MNSYEEQLKTVFRSAQMHLYLTCAESGRFVPVQRRNEILIKRLKPFVDDKACREIKSHVKRVILLGRQGQDMEACINQMLSVINSSSVKYDRMMALAEWLVTAIDAIKEPIQFSTSEQPVTVDHNAGEIRFNRVQIENCFNEDGQQIAPMMINYRYTSEGNLIALKKVFNSDYQLIECVVLTNNTANFFIIDSAHWMDAQ